MTHNFSTIGGLDNIQFYVPQPDPPLPVKSVARPTRKRRESTQTDGCRNASSTDCRSRALTCKSEEHKRLTSTVADPSTIASKAICDAASGFDFISGSTSHGPEHDQAPPIRKSPASTIHDADDQVQACTVSMLTNEHPPLHEMHGSPLRANTEHPPQSSSIDKDANRALANVQSDPNEPVIIPAPEPSTYCRDSSLLPISCEQDCSQSRSLTSYLDDDSGSSGSASDEPRIPRSMFRRRRDFQASLRSSQHDWTHHPSDSSTRPPQLSTIRRRSARLQRGRRQIQQPGPHSSSRESSLPSPIMPPTPTYKRVVLPTGPTLDRRPIQCLLTSEVVGSKVRLTLEIPPLDMCQPAPKLAFTTDREKKRNIYSEDDDKLLLRLRRQTNPKLTWKQIHNHFPGRTKGSIQVHYSTKLKAKGGKRHSAFR